MRAPHALPRLPTLDCRLAARRARRCPRRGRSRLPAEALLKAALVAYMRDLHVYVEPADSGARDRHAAFYSRRADGPFYRWLDAEGSGRWRYSPATLDR